MENTPKLEDMTTKEKKEKREEARETKKVKKNPPHAGAHACSGVRGNAAANPSEPNAKGAAALKREADLLARNYRLETEARRAKRCLRDWYVALRNRKAEIAALKREADERRQREADERRTLCDVSSAFVRAIGQMQRIDEAWNEFVGAMLGLSTACKRFADKLSASRPGERTPETEGGAQ